jgi:hypothetical protein
VWMWLYAASFVAKVVLQELIIVSSSEVQLKEKIKDMVCATIQIQLWVLCNHALCRT